MYKAFRAGKTSKKTLGRDQQNLNGKGDSSSEKKSLNGKTEFPKEKGDAKTNARASNGTHKQTTNGSNLHRRK